MHGNLLITPLKTCKYSMKATFVIAVLAVLFGCMNYVKRAKLSCTFISISIGHHN